MKNDRKIKGSSQNIFLIETIMPESEKEKKFDVMGSTGNVYTVTIKDIPECTCPDFRLRNKRCKHIYFILIKVMKTHNEDEDIYEEDDLKIEREEWVNWFIDLQYSLGINKDSRKWK